MLSRDFPCKCGHEQRLHNFNGDWMIQCYGGLIEGFGYCECQIFRPDNLKFIERLGG